MKDFGKLKYFIRERGIVSIPLIQKEYGVSYLIARQEVNKFVNEGVLRFVGGVSYEYRLTREELIAQRRREFDWRIAEEKSKKTPSLFEVEPDVKKANDELESFMFGDGDDDYDDEDEIDEEEIRRIIAECESDAGKLKKEGIKPTGQKTIQSGKVAHEDVFDKKAWKNKQEFNTAFFEELDRFIKTDKRMGRKGALKKARDEFHRFFVTKDVKNTDIYRRIIGELEDISDAEYRQLKAIVSS